MNLKDSGYKPHLMSEDTNSILARTLSEMNITNPVYSLIRSKAGISVYRVESQESKLILKAFDNMEDTREIDNYLLLSKLGITTLQLLNYTSSAILLQDVAVSAEYRLGVKDDLKDPRVARSVAKWYKELHSKGARYLADNNIPMYDESDAITLPNMEFVAMKSDTKDNSLWKAVADHYNIIRSRIDALPRTLTYNDFYYTNLIVAKDYSSAFMFDYNMLGKGIAYGDVRNVTSSLSPEAATVFKNEYNTEGLEAEALADAFISPLVTLYHACQLRELPLWAKGAYDELKNGYIENHLNEWLNTEENYEL